MDVDFDPHQLVGHIVPHSYDPGYIVLSYLVSFSGCWTALELLYRRTSADGFHNWYLLLAAAASMGSVAIWCMHFIGNRAIIMNHDKAGFQIEYSPGFTAGSFFLPICGVGVAFYFFSISENVGVFGTMAGGLMLGLAICGMHYMGNGGISNFVPSYDWEYVLGSALIAVAASTIALRVFFHFKAQWTNNWFKRALCAALLATAVSGMHWVATVGTHYRLHYISNVSRNGLSRQATVVVVICLSVGACLVLFTYAVLGQRSKLKTSHRVQQVVLASITFDEEYRLLVTPGGHLPTRKIINTYFQKGFGDRFDVEHHVFCWCFRASRCWHGISEIVPAIQSHLKSIEQTKSSGYDPLSRMLQLDSETETDFSTLFKELFLVTANELADSLQEQLDSIGVLFDEMMSTGTEKGLKPARRMLSKTGRAKKDCESGEVEMGHIPLLGRGQVLFLVRKVSNSDATRIQASGFRFARVNNIADILAKSMEVNKDRMQDCLRRMQGYVSAYHPTDWRTQIALFALRPLYNRGFDIIVQKARKQLLPSVTLPYDTLDDWQLETLVSLDGLTVTTVRERLQRLSVSPSIESRQFADHFIEVMNTLGAQVNNSLFEDAQLIAKPFQVPVVSDQQHTMTRTLIAFRLILNAHELNVLGDSCGFSPLKFFLCQQHTPNHGMEDEVFSRKIRHEFAHYLDHRLTKETSNPPRIYQTTSLRSPGLERKIANSIRWPGRTPLVGAYSFSKDNISEHNLVSVTPTPNKQSNDLQTRDTNLTVAGSGRSESNRDPEPNASFLSNSSEEVLEDLATFADDILAITLEEQKRLQSKS